MVYPSKQSVFKDFVGNLYFLVKMGDQMGDVIKKVRLRCGRTFW
ncbi:hypothetical protein DFQ12_1230 [Sphingobacterium detergens]|uniref:Uncharacterized protein n=1 Tax=Sphingobacterium detergens TaxID=1145106 RepID=A0A420BI45_SPHD1|nr:hypothetical protein DFQ12_1230 [Sphingobacterium detergens]